MAPSALWLAVVASGLSWGEPGNGRSPFSRADGKESARPRGSTCGRRWSDSAGHARGDPSLSALLVALVQWQQQIQIGAESLVIGARHLVSSTDAIRGCWREYDRHNWGSGRLPWQSRMAPD